MTTPLIAHPPATLEGWYALHQIFRTNKSRLEPRELNRLIKAASARLRGSSARSSGSTSKRKPKVEATAGWSCFVSLIGSTSDVMAIHFRDTLDGIGEAQSALAQTALARALDPVYAFLSVTEAGLYHISAELARDAEARGGKAGDETYLRLLGERSEKERASAHVIRRLYPELPADMPYVCFYPMSKRRQESQNWYTLSLDERSRLMQSHGLTGRRYAGKVQQVITGAIGLDAWEWGVTLFAKDALDFKRLVTDMRFDEVSARYAEFGDFYVGRVVTG
ncbi:MAG: hydrogen peroxide-dependent heme synthase [Gemmatimonadaceae bacterium]|jgi:chlorite dismutase|nr:hydrogen peroxide-dependent heme synthase [Gemmatimonadaceae bacterium]